MDKAGEIVVGGGGSGAAAGSDSPSALGAATPAPASKRPRQGMAGASDGGAGCSAASLHSDGGGEATMAEDTSAAGAGSAASAAAAAEALFPAEAPSAEQLEDQFLQLGGHLPVELRENQSLRLEALEDAIASGGLGNEARALQLWWLHDAVADPIARQQLVDTPPSFPPDATPLVYGIVGGQGKISLAAASAAVDLAHLAGHSLPAVFALPGGGSRSGYVNIIAHTHSYYINGVVKIMELGNNKDLYYHGENIHVVVSVGSQPAGAKVCCVDKN
jgi:hypothetical protein